MLIDEKMLMQDYAAVRNANAADLAARRRAAFEACPALEEADQALRQAAFRKIQKVLHAQNRAQAAAQADAEIEALRMLRNDLLAQNGFPPDQLEMRYRCCKCCDTGYVGTAPKQPCSCLKQRRMRLLYASSSIDPSAGFASFDCSVFPAGAQREQMQKVCKYFETFADAFPETDVRTLVVMGKTGLGKTFLLDCVAERVLSRGFSVVKVTAYNLIHGILENIRAGERAETYDEADLLIIDDLGTEPMLNNITREYLFSIVNERQNAGKHLAIATNLDIDRLQDVYGERMFSRLLTPRLSKVQRLTGVDIRLHNI